MNPRWEELSEAMAQTASSAASKQKNDKPDLVSRIFKMKVDSMMEDLTKKNIFGCVKAYLYGVEWQKRGFPHVHILLWMEQRVNAELVDSVISAEISDKEKEPRLYNIVTRCMIQGPCKDFDEFHACCHGKSVNGKGKCQKDFPKPCRGDLLFGRNGYPLYKRRAVGEGGHSFSAEIKGELKTIDNSWVVPYNPYLCLKYNAHINVECSNSIKCIAYATKYINKGCDRILFTKTGEKDDIVNEHLTHRLGPTSFTDIRTVNGHIYPTFREAVKAMDLLNDEDTWKQTFLEIINHINDRRQLRATYASVLVFSPLEDQSNIWE
ncbi:uncharacterized protein LOC143041635 [Oratosquilla oratoria]|uniref:uncharacterized protein LOC143041635 n=1 Tax=Oratosquilla oratoria TaxID=337810 RepID=UPI003F75B5C9